MPNVAQEQVAPEPEVSDTSSGYISVISALSPS